MTEFMWGLFVGWSASMLGATWIIGYSDVVRARRARNGDKQ